jgi:hypothetical protein
MVLPFLLPAVGGRLPVLRSPLLLLVTEGLSCAETASVIVYLVKQRGMKFFEAAWASCSVRVHIYILRSNKVSTAAA